MKLCILAGGFGTRIAEKTHLVPKPMIEIGGKPILWHIMKYFSVFGFRDFVILGGYKINIIKDYFKSYAIQTSRIMKVNTSTGKVSSFGGSKDNWNIEIVDTGVETMTGSRILQASDVIGNKPFALTYGDGVADINLNDLIQFHQRGKYTVSITSVQPEARYGALEISDSGKVTSFIEKPTDEGGWINGGFMICDPKIFEYIPSKTETILETDILKRLSQEGVLGAFKHHGFWRPMDTLRDKNILEKMYAKGNAKWKIW